MSLIEMDAAIFCVSLDNTVTRIFKLCSASLRDTHKDRMKELESWDEESTGLSVVQSGGFFEDLYLEERVALSAMTFALLVIQLEDFLNRYRFHVSEESKGHGEFVYSLPKESFRKLKDEYSKSGMDLTQLTGYQTCLEVVLARNDFVHHSAKSRAQYKQYTAQQFLECIQSHYSGALEVLIVDEDALLDVADRMKDFVEAFSVARGKTKREQ